MAESSFLGNSGDAVQLLGNDGKPYSIPQSLLSTNYSQPQTPGGIPIVPIDQPVAAKPTGEVVSAAPNDSGYGFKTDVQVKPADIVPQVPQGTENVPQKIGEAPKMQASAAGLTGAMDKGSPASADYMNMKVNPMLAGYNQGFGLEAAGLAQQAKTEGELGKKQSEIYNKELATQQIADSVHKNAMDEMQTRITESNAKYQKMQDDYMKTSAIDPNRYFHNQTTGQKIMSGIGIFLAGLGSGLTGTPNLALKIMDDAINRDIESQKMSLDKKKTGLEMQSNLVGKLYQEFGNKDLAYNMAKKMTYDNVELQMKQAAAQTSDPMSKARLLQGLGELQIKKQQLMGPIQQMMFQQSLMSGGMSGGGSPLQKISYIQDEKIKDAALKELPAFQQHEANKQSILNALKIMNENTNPASVEQRNKFNQAKAVLLSNTSELFGGKSEQEFKIMEGLTPGMTWNKDTYNNAVGLINQKADSMKSFPVLEQLGLKKPGTSTVTSFKAGK